MNTNNQIFYQIFIRNHSKEGTIKAVTKDLQRIHSLGIDIIYLMPINEIGLEKRKGTMGSPYASKNYFSISKDLGTLEDLKDLINETHKFGMKIILDMVFNHTSPDNVLVTTHKDFYYLKDGKFGNRIGDWNDIIDLDTNKEKTQDYLISVLKYWIQQGFDGFRFDVASMIPLSFFKKARRELGNDIIFFGESIEFSFSKWLISQGHYACDDEEMIPTFDCLYNYSWFRHFEQYMFNDSTIEPIIEELNRPSRVRRVNCLENHDNYRLMHYAKGNKRLFRNLLAFSTLLNGDLFLYAGEEYGISHKPELFEKDPIDWNNSNPDLFNFVKRLIEIKHQDKDTYKANCQVMILSKDVVKISKSDLIGYFSFIENPYKIELDGQYINLIDQTIIKGGEVLLIEPLILKKYE